MAEKETNPDSLSTTVFVLVAGGAVAFFITVAIFVLR